MPPFNEIICHLTCIKQINIAKAIPILQPITPSNKPSAKNIFKIDAFVAPMLFKMLISFFFSNTNIVKALIILKAAIININVSTA